MNWNRIGFSLNMPRQLPVLYTQKNAVEKRLLNWKEAAVKFKRLHRCCCNLQCSTAAGITSRQHKTCLMGGRKSNKKEQTWLRDVGDFKGTHEFCMVCSISYESKVQTAGRRGHIVILLEPCDMGAKMCKKAEKELFCYKYNYSRRLKNTV